MVIDAVTEKLFGRPFDRDGRIAASGGFSSRSSTRFLRRDFFRRQSSQDRGARGIRPRVCARISAQLWTLPKAGCCGHGDGADRASIADAVRRFVISNSSRAKTAFHEMILSGGGAKNSTLVAMLTGRTRAARIASALLRRIWLALGGERGRGLRGSGASKPGIGGPSNIPSATGARRAAVLGKISYP